MIPVLAWVAYNVAVAAVFAFDKRRAKASDGRVPERVLWWLTALGGAAGAWAGMRLFRHKTKKPRFVWGVPLLLMLQLGMIAGGFHLMGPHDRDVAEWIDAGCSRSPLFVPSP